MPKSHTKGRVELQASQSSSEEWTTEAEELGLSLSAWIRMSLDNQMRLGRVQRAELDSRAQKPSGGKQSSAN